ncbi:hypothetical protein BU17DRAFT_66136 [Hysterangium stoloniferum]|nr:hypothetical protein BU17DRAFT_66136 [Hysterangium stoloniferum]
MSHSNSPSSAFNASTPISNITESTTLFPEQGSDLIARKLHANLDARLQPFWSGAVSNRLVRLRIFCPNAGEVPELAHDDPFKQQSQLRARTWPRFPHLYTYFLGSVYRVSGRHPSRDVACTINYSISGVNPSVACFVSTAYTPGDQVTGTSHIVTRVTVPLPVPYVPLRLISDIDDTIKYAGVLHGENNAINPMPSRDSLYGSTPSLSKSYSPSIGSNSSPVQMGAFVTHASTPSMLPGIPPRGKTQAGMTPEEHRRQELEIPIEYARAEISSHIAFRVFRTPEEGVEMQDIVREHPEKVA